MSESTKRLKRKAGAISVVKVESFNNSGYPGIKVYLSGVSLDEIRTRRNEIISVTSQYIANSANARKIVFDNLYDPEMLSSDKNEEPLTEKDVTEDVLVDVFYNMLEEETFQQESNDIISFVY